MPGSPSCCRSRADADLALRFVFHEDVIRFPWRTGQPVEPIRVHLPRRRLAVDLLLPVLLHRFRTCATGRRAGRLRLFVGVEPVGLGVDVFFIAAQLLGLCCAGSFPTWQADVLRSVRLVLVPCAELADRAGSGLRRAVSRCFRG